MKLSSYNEWDKLRTVVVGDASYANWPSTDPIFKLESTKTSWKETPVPNGPVPQWIVDEANEDLEILADTLTGLGVDVLRPKAMDFVKLQGMYNYCPRDRLIVAGEDVIDPAMMYPCRNQEGAALNFVYHAAKRIHIMPRDKNLVLDAANVCRLGDTWLYLISPSGNTEAYLWLANHLPHIKIELCNFYSGVHIDSTIVPLREGLVLVNGSRVNEDNLPKAFKDWEVIYITEDQITAQDFYQYPYASKWIGLNMFSVDPNTVIVDRKQHDLIDLLEKKGFTTIPLELRHSRTLGGGFHCVTLDLIRF